MLVLDEGKSVLMGNYEEFLKYREMSIIPENREVAASP